MQAKDGKINSEENHFLTCASNEFVKRYAIGFSDGPKARSLSEKGILKVII